MAVAYSISSMGQEHRKSLRRPSALSHLETSPTLPLAMGFLRFFQNYISPADGARCALYPTCSEYSLQALKKHGLLRGAVLTFDRLLHEPDERRMRRPEWIKGAYRVRDPLSSNELRRRQR